MMEATARAAVVLDRLQHGVIQTFVVQQKLAVAAGGQALVNGAVMMEPRRPKEKKRRE